MARKVRDIPHHVEPLPGEAGVPIRHYQRTTTDIWNTLAYIERAAGERDHYPAAVKRHLGRLYGMASIGLIEAFERLLKELAAVCIDRLSGLIADDRLDTFSIKGGTLAAHFGGSLGQSLCESSTWLSCQSVNDRFRDLLADPFESGKFYLFPGPNQKPEAERWRYEPMSLVWQLRHAAVHNVGVITRSDAIKLGVLAREPVAGGVMLAPTRPDLRYLRRFLDETADTCNGRVGRRLAELLTAFHDATPGRFVPQELADRLAADFRVPAVVAGATGVVPAD